jgi:hypothetical protein
MLKLSRREEHAVLPVLAAGPHTGSGRAHGPDGERRSSGTASRNSWRHGQGSQGPTGTAGQTAPRRTLAYPQEVSTAALA